MKKLLMATATLLALTSSALGQHPLPPYIHNGSVVNIAINPQSGELAITYIQPKPSLVAIGLTPGVLLITGSVGSPFDQWVEAVAYVYDTVCGAVPYPVRGRFEGYTLILQGPAPVVWAGTCRIAEYRWTHNSDLRFYPLPPR
jgi:hypothetical protein